MSDISRFGVDGTRVAGLAVTFLGFAGLALFPALYVRYRVMNAVQLEGHLAWFVAVTGSILLLWGISTVRTGRWRSLTPRRAALAPVLVFGAHAAVALRMNAWSGGGRGSTTLLVEFLTWTFAWEQLPGGVGSAGALFGVAAVAAFRGQRDWVVRALGGVAVLGVVLGSVTGHLVVGFVDLLIRSAVMGLGAAVVGYYAAISAPPGSNPAETTPTGPQSTAE